MFIYMCAKIIFINYLDCGFFRSKLMVVVLMILHSLIQTSNFQLSRVGTIGPLRFVFSVVAVKVMQRLTLVIMIYVSTGVGCSYRD